MSFILKILTLGLLSLHLKRKEKKLAKKREKQAADELAAAKFLQEKKAAKEAAEARYRASVEAEELKFSQNPWAYIAEHFELLSGAIRDNLRSIGKNFGPDWKDKALQNVYLCREMEKYLKEHLQPPFNKEYYERLREEAKFRYKEEYSLYLHARYHSS